MKTQNKKSVFSKITVLELSEEHLFEISGGSLQISIASVALSFAISNAYFNNQNNEALQQCMADQ